MAEIFITVLVFIAVMAIAAVLFGGWVVIGIIRLIFNLITRVTGGSNASISSATHKLERTCEQQLCRARNPANAKYCRRCGRAMSTPQQVAVRRAAMF